MTLGRVIGNMVSTVNTKDYQGRKILVVQPVDPNGKAKGTSFLAIDVVQAGVGDIVLTLDEGGSAKIAVNESDSHTLKVIVVGIVDEIKKVI
jgi:ethanolamine utilization protein EutN